MEAPALSAGPPQRDLAPGKRGLKRRLYARPRTVILMLDETIITEMPPLAYAYGRRGEQVAVPVPGTHARRVLHGVLNIQSGDVLLFITETWDHTTHQAFLRMMRAHWRGWQIVLFEDRGAPHTAAASRRLAKALHIALRFLPTGTPELNAMDHLWRDVKGRVLANRPVASIDAAADQACQAILALSRRERLRKAGVLSGHFWLTTGSGTIDRGAGP